MGRTTVVAACSLNQWALDWEGNVARIKESILVAKSRGAKLRVGPELEICGYGCLDHFLESDTYLHCWELLRQILKDDECHDILLDLGMPVEHRHSRYNCRVLVLNGKILLIRPKLLLDNDGNHQEQRYFATWGPQNFVEDFQLPLTIAKDQGSNTVPFGDASIATVGAYISAYSYSELLIPKSPPTAATANRVPIQSISTASNHELGGFDARFVLLQEAARESGGVLLYSDQRGCGGDRTYSDGCAMIFMNGELVAQGRQFSLEDVEVVTAKIQVDDVEASGSVEVHNPTYGLNEGHCLSADYDMFSGRYDTLSNGYAHRIERPIFQMEEQMEMGPACWIWDYLRRSNAAGFVVPLSGGIDSGCTATIIFSMCRLVLDALQAGNEQVKADVQRIAGTKDWLPKTPSELCKRFLHTIYMGVSGHSSEKTRFRARRLAEAIGAHHTDMNIDHVYQAEKDLLRQYMGHTPTFESGLPAENLALQNIQARIRMVTAYYFAQMLPTTRGRLGGGTLLVLGSINVEECVRGSLTKHDCSSADLSPIGSFSKLQIRSFVRWACTSFSLPVLEEFLNATPSAELEPTRFGQDDFKDMGMTHLELSTFARLRKEMRLGPFSMFQQLLLNWRGQKSSRAIADVVKKFHYFYGINRHKMSSLTPAYHAGKSNPDDHRYDMRPMLYPGFEGSWSCKRIDELTEQLERSSMENSEQS